MADISKISVGGTSYNVKDATKVNLPNASTPQGYVPKSNGDGTVTWSAESGGGSTAGDIAYNGSTTYPNGTVGKELKEQSEKIANISDVDITPNSEHIVGRYIFMDGDVKKSKPIYQSSYLTTHTGTWTVIATIPNVENVLELKGTGAINTTQIYTIPWLPQGMSSFMNVLFDPRDNSIYYSFEGSYSQNVIPSIIIIMYTKTTDTPTPV